MGTSAPASDIARMCAVANAHASVLAAADHIAPRNSEDGVAVTLARVFGL